ncbi:MAG: hypothetical protein LQ340_002384 [Diploschistes diacapsis]|nr:MAG: hypothetical protein LQ340_002384 [Diploschistes diacapsis]
MDPLVQRELSRIEPDVPFRAKTTHSHHTWARTYHSRPELYIQPESTEEIQKVVTLARKCQRRIVVVGSGHSPSDLTCTSSWMVNLDRYSSIISINSRTKVATMQAGIRLRDLIEALGGYGLTMPNLGSINEQSIAGAFTTGTHGSSIKHGIIARSVLGLKIMLSNGRIVSCSAEQNRDLFRAALVSLGAIGIIIEVTFQAVPSFNIRWKQNLITLDDVLERWNSGLWDETEFTRVWWFPYMLKCVHWQADKTREPPRPAKPSWLSGRAGYHIYHALLYVAQWVPRIIPLMEWFVINVQYGGNTVSAIEDGSQGLLMNCLYSQFVNEWAIPLSKGPEAMKRLSIWLHGDREGSGIPYDPSGIYVHAPIEVRVAAAAAAGEIRPFLENTMADEPSLLLNATLYRPYDLDPPAHMRYYEAFQWLMMELGGRPHWAKNFTNITPEEIEKMYPELSTWLRIREEVDPEGMFLGHWHRKLLFSDTQPKLRLEEEEIKTRPYLSGGIMWHGQVPKRLLSPQNSEESFDLMHGAEAEKSVFFDDGE